MEHNGKVAKFIFIDDLSQTHSKNTKINTEAIVEWWQSRQKHIEEMVRKENKVPTKEQLYEIYKRQGGSKPLEELKQCEWTMLSLIYYVERAKDSAE